jgi:hypothetical protein
LTCQTPNAQKIKRFALQAGVISGLALLAACGGPPHADVTAAHGPRRTWDHDHHDHQLADAVAFTISHLRPSLLTRFEGCCAARSNLQII